MLMLPKVKRRAPVMGSMPMVETNRPRAPASRPLNTLPPETPIIMDSPNRAMANISGGPNFRANSATGKEKTIRTTVPIRPPMTE